VKRPVSEYEALVQIAEDVNWLRNRQQRRDEIDQRLAIAKVEREEMAREEYDRRRAEHLAEVESRYLAAGGILPDDYQPGDVLPDPRISKLVQRKPRRWWWQ
jgi:hypothetical protein